MSLLTLLILSGLVAAVAFFLAGFLLRSPRKGGADSSEEARRREALEGEINRLREEQKGSKTALAQAMAECQTEAGARKREEEKRIQVERERDSARSEAERQAAAERIASKRLRVAEDQNRAAFERVEKQAEAWGAQLQATKTEQNRHEQALREELEQLRAEASRHKPEQALLVKELEQLRGEAVRQHAERTRLAEERAQEEAERARLVEEPDRQATRADEAERAIEELRGQIQEWESESKRLHGALLAAEEREREVLRHLAEAETSWQGKALADEEAFAHEHEQARIATEALRAAEARLADLDRLAQENAELREQQAEAAREAKWQAGRGDEAKDAKVELAAAQAKLVELGRILEENRKLRDEAAELRQHQEASGELERLTTAHKQLRLDAELMARRLQELTQDRSELVSLRTQAGEAASLVQEVEYLRRREKDLEAQLYASGLYASREIPAVSGELLVQTPVSNMETNLHSLVHAGGPRTAVLADAQGFLIAGAGESAAQEGLAAFAAVAGEMVSRARMLLPLAEVESLRVTDRNSIVLTCHLFDSAGEGLGITTLGPGEPEAGNTARAIVELSAIVSGVEPAATQEPEPAT